MPLIYNPTKIEQFVYITSVYGEKLPPNLGVWLIRGYKPLEVINMHNFQMSNIEPNYVATVCLKF